MRFDIVISIAVLALRRSLMRTCLTALGLIIGVAAVITIVSLGQGARASIEEEVEGAGTNLVIVSAGNWTAGGVRLGMGSSSTLTADDAEAIGIPRRKRLRPSRSTHCDSSDARPDEQSGDAGLLIAQGDQRIYAAGTASRPPDG
ncbi:hypothetical protein BH24ACI5_BH24ACI5_26560 [soil metagenome]